MKVYILRAKCTSRVIATYTANDDNPIPDVVMARINRLGYDIQTFHPGVPRTKEEWNDMLRQEIQEEEERDLAAEWPEKY